MTAVVPTSSTADLSAYCVDLARRARAASRLLATASGASKNAWLLRTAQELEQRSDEVLAANEKDLAGAAQLGLSAAQIDRLRLTPARLCDAAAGLLSLAALAAAGVVFVTYRRYASA